MVAFYTVYNASGHSVSLNEIKGFNPFYLMEKKV